MTDSLGDKAAVGAIWSTIQTIAARLMGISANLALAWLLTREDFGLFGKAATIAAFCEVFGAGGIGTILIVRKNKFHRWAEPAQWLGLSLGITVSILMIVCGMVITLQPGTQRASELFVIISLMALTPLFRSFATVPYAKLRIDMRFKKIAVLETIMMLGSSIFKVALAFFGCGAFSFVIPTVATAFVRSAYFWKVSGVKFSRSLGLKRWKYLFDDGLMLILTALLFKLVTYGDYAILTLFVSLEQLGVYFFAFTYSVMGVVMLTAGLNGVLVPTFASIENKDRRNQAFVRSASLLLALVCPLCFLQSAVSEPAVNLLLKDTWQPAIILLQILSLGMAGRTISWLAASLMESQRRFRTRFLLGIISAAIFLTIVLLGASTLGTLGVAIGVAIFFPIMSAGATLVALNDSGNAVSLLGKIVFKPVISSAIAVFLPWMFFVYLSFSNVAQLIFIPSATIVIYTILLRSWNRETYSELVSKLQTIFAKFRNSRLSHAK